MDVWTEISTAVAGDFDDFGSTAAAVRIVLRLLMAAVLGAVLGFERQASGKSAGIRTHALVALGATLFVLVPTEMGASTAGIARVVQGLVAGIGFLGAGAIVKGEPGENIRGLTTAAGIWATAGVGMTIALGHLTTAVMATLLALAIFRLLPSMPATTQGDWMRRSARGGAPLIANVTTGSLQVRLNSAGRPDPRLLPLVIFLGANGDDG